MKSILVALMTIAWLSASALAQATRPANAPNEQLAWLDQIKLVYAFPADVNVSRALQVMSNRIAWAEMGLQQPIAKIKTDTWAIVELRAARPMSRQEGLAAIERFKRLFDTTLPLDQRRKQYEEIEQQYGQAESAAEVLHGINESYTQLFPKMLADRIQTTLSDRNRLEMELMAKEARAKAIAGQIDAVRRRAEANASQDVILAQLKRVVELRKGAIKEAESRFAAAIGSREDVNKAEQALAEAQIRLAEREESLRLASKGDLLAKLTDELATIAIDTTEMMAKLQYLRENSPPADLSQLTEKDLQRLASQYRGLYVPPGLPPLYHELDKRLNKLIVEKLRTVVSEVRELTPQEAQSLHNR